ncbi:MAG TPA: alkaline phosphatase D family protein, partial [Actinomycetota bacterium]|nr:alkaline phosphatase D family protein [Actinomycetota bacterium]
DTGPDRDFTVVVDVDGLEPATTYWYRFESSSERSPVGRTRTMPGGDAPLFTLGMVSCARYSVAPLTVYRALAEVEVDLVLHLGDYIYDDEGKKGPRTHQPPREVKQLADYRQRLAQIRMDRDCQALHLRHPMAFIWDDHDFADNAWSGGAKKHDPDEDGPWSVRRDEAIQALGEWLPWRRTNESGPASIYRALPIGNLAELIRLDSRIIGRDAQASSEGAKPIDDPSRSLLGNEQWEWLDQRLSDTSRPWALVANGVVFNPIPMDLPAERLLKPILPRGYVELEDGTVLRDDQWDGYPRERDKLLQLIGSRKQADRRTVLLSGDVHSSWAFEGPGGPDGSALAVEATVPSVASTPMGRTRPPGVWRILDYAVRRLEHVRWVDITSRGFAVLQIKPEEVTVGWWFVDPYETEDHPRAEVGAAFRSRLKGRPRWEEVSPAPELGVDRHPVPALPPRPDDVPYMRRWHLRRRFGLFSLVAAVVAALTGGLGWLVRSRRS